MSTREVMGSNLNPESAYFYWNVFSETSDMYGGPPSPLLNWYRLFCSWNCNVRRVCLLARLWVRNSIQSLHIFTVMFSPKRPQCIGPTHPPIELLPALLFLELQREDSKTCYSSPSSGEGNNEWRNASIPPIRLQDVTRDNFAFALIYSRQIQTHYSK